MLALTTRVFPMMVPTPPLAPRVLREGGRNGGNARPSNEKPWPYGDADSNYQGFQGSGDGFGGGPGGGDRDSFGFGAAPSHATSATSREARVSSGTQQIGAGTVWDRRNPPAYMTSKRSKAYWLLGIDGEKRLTGADLRSAYRRAAMESHPDKLQNHTRQHEANELFQQVKAAYDYLSSTGVAR